MQDFLLLLDELHAWVVVGIVLAFGAVELASGFLKRSRRSFGDWIQEAGSFAVLGLVTKPLLLLASVAALDVAAPGLLGAVAGWPFLAALAVFVLVDDFLQYSYHRLAHERPFLWKLHRPHHQAEEMGFFVSYRNASLYYFMMPNIWWMGVFTYLGGGPAIALGLVLKQVVVISSHSTLPWDAPFYRSRLLRPFVLLAERVIVTPAFHHAHHGRSKLDGIGDPNANFGNMFSIWDQLFGTAVYTHQFPESYGLHKPTDDHWAVTFGFPLVHSRDVNSEMARGFQKPITAVDAPATLHLEAGKKYLWCTCGLSKEQPFCDGSHHGTRHKPLLFEAKRSGPVKLCNCKRTAKGPFCDNAHVGQGDRR